MTIDDLKASPPVGAGQPTLTSATEELELLLPAATDKVQDAGNGEENVQN